MFTDAYDVMVFENHEKILENFRTFNASVVFGAEYLCMPDPKKANRFPNIKACEKRFLNSGGYIGYKKNIKKIISYMIEKYNVKPSESDQKNFQEVYLNAEMREKHNIKLDHNSTIFFNVYGSADDVEFHCINRSVR